MLQRKNGRRSHQQPAFTVKTIFILNAIPELTVLFILLIFQILKTMVMKKIEIPESRISPIVDANDNIYYMGLIIVILLDIKDGDTFKY